MQVAKPDGNLICFTAADPAVLNVFHLSDLMRKRGWFIQIQLTYEDSPANIHISVTPNAARTAPKVMLLHAAWGGKKGRLPEACQASKQTKI